MFIFCLTFSFYFHLKFVLKYFFLSKYNLIFIFFSYGADPNFHISLNNLNIQKSDKVTPLMYAARKGDLELIYTILKHDPLINNKDSNNRNALFYSILAEKGDNADIVLTLIKSNINVNDCEFFHIQKSVEGHSPLTLATKKNLKNTVKALLDNNSNLDFQIPLNGNTALHFAVINNNPEIVKMLINSKANIEVKNKDNKTSMQLAFDFSYGEIFEILKKEANKLNEEKEKIAQDIVRNEENENNIFNNWNSSTKKNKKKGQAGNKEKENINLIINSSDYTNEKNYNCEPSNLTREFEINYDICNIFSY